MCVFALELELGLVIVKVMVVEMEGVTALTDAVKIFHDQFWVTHYRKSCPPKTRTSAETGKGGLTRSRTRDSFARDWNDRLLSEYRFGCSEAGFEFGTSAVTTNLG